MEEKKSLIEVNYAWCKACGICYGLCPRSVLDKDELGKVIVKNEDNCTRCRICEDHCPDYCIRIGG